MDAKELKARLTDNDILFLMKELNIPFINSNTTNEVHFKTACHGGDSYKLYFYKDTKTFYCYTHCGSLDIISIVENILGFNIKQAIKWICRKINISCKCDFDNSFGFDLNIEDDFEFLDFKYNRQISKEPVFEFLDDKILNSFGRYYHPFFYEDGISFSTMDKYNIRYDILNQRIIIPHYDINNNIIAIRCRNTDENLIKNGMKYIPITHKGKLLSAKTSDYLYGLNLNIENIKKCKRVIIFESEKSVMQMESILQGNNISVALCGSNISDFQIKQLQGIGANEIILALDKEYENFGDKEYENYIKKIKKSKIDRLKHRFEVSLILDCSNLLERKDSPSDKGKEIFFKLYNSRIYFKE